MPELFYALVCPRYNTLISIVSSIEKFYVDERDVISRNIIKFYNPKKSLVFHFSSSASSLNMETFVTSPDIYVGANEVVEYEDIRDESDAKRPKLSQELQLTYFPDEILLKIFRCLKTYDILRNVALVCRRFYRLSKDHNLLREFQFSSKSDLHEKISLRRNAFNVFNQSRCLTKLTIDMRDFTYYKSFVLTEIIEAVLKNPFLKHGLKSLKLDFNETYRHVYDHNVSGHFLTVLSNGFDELECLDVNGCGNIHENVIRSIAVKCPKLKTLILGETIVSGFGDYVSRIITMIKLIIELLPNLYRLRTQCHNLGFKMQDFSPSKWEKVLKLKNRKNNLIIVDMVAGGTGGAICWNAKTKQCSFVCRESDFDRTVKNVPRYYKTDNIRFSE